MLARRFGMLAAAAAAMLTGCGDAGPVKAKNLWTYQAPAARKAVMASYQPVLERDARAFFKDPSVKAVAFGNTKDGACGVVTSVHGRFFVHRSVDRLIAVPEDDPSFLMWTENLCQADVWRNHRVDVSQWAPLSFGGKDEHLAYAQLERAMRERPLEGADESLLFVQAQDAVRSILRDPGSATFDGLKQGRAEGSPIACGYVNSRNGLGGMTGRQRFVATATVAFLEEQSPAAVDAAWASCR